MAKSISLQEIHLSNIGVRSEFGAKLGQAMAMNPLCRLVKRIKFIYSEETTKFEEIFHLTVLNNVKTKWKTSSKENLNFSLTNCLFMDLKFEWQQKKLFLNKPSGYSRYS